MEKMDKGFSKDTILVHTEYDYKTKTKEMLEAELRFAHLPVGGVVYEDSGDYYTKRISEKEFHVYRTSDDKLNEVFSIINNSFQYMGC
jgi:hypothetical protein